MADWNYLVTVLLALFIIMIVVGLLKIFWPWVMSIAGISLGSGFLG